MHQNYPHTLRGMNRSQHLENLFINSQKNAQCSWRRPFLPYGRRHMMPGRYINIGIRHFPPDLSRPNAPIPYKYVPDVKHSVSNQSFVTNPSIVQKPQFFLVPGNAIGNENSQYVTNSNERNLVAVYSTHCKANPILSYQTPNISSVSAPIFVQNPPFYSVPYNMFHSQSNPSIAPVADNSGCQSKTEITNKTNTPVSTNTLSRLIFPTAAPAIRMDYYNVNTEESTWNKILNADLVTSNAMNQSSIPQNREQINKVCIEHQNQNKQEEPVNRSCVDSVSNIFSMSSEAVMIPPNTCNAPLQNIYNAPPPNIFISSGNINPNNTAYFDIQSIMPPLVFQNSLITNNLSSNIVINEGNHSVSQNTLSNNKTFENISNVTNNMLPITGNDQFVQRQQKMLSNNNAIYYNQCIISNNHNSSTHDHFPKNEMSDFSNSNSSVEICYSSTSTDKTILINDIKKEPPIVNNNVKDSNVNELSDNPSLLIKVKNEFTKTTVDISKQGNQTSNDVENIANKNIANKNINENNHTSHVNLIQIKQTDKSRPVCSTPVPGTSWCVVWTGDEKVFFYNSQRKLSVWERSGELLNRSDVDKMIKKNPVSTNSKVMTTNVSETSSENLLRIEQIRKEDLKDKKDVLKENSDVKKTCTNNNGSNINSVSKLSEKSRYEGYSLEERTKIFCEMLSEKKVSILSSWEKEIHKVIPDPRYSLLTQEQRKEVFTDYIKKNVEDEIIKRRQKYQLQKAKFLSLLIEAGVTPDSRYTDIAQQFAEDERFKGLTDTALKESIFNQYISKLILNNQEKDNSIIQQKKEIVKLSYANENFEIEKIEVQNSSVNDGLYKAITKHSTKTNTLKEYIHEKYENTPQAKRLKRINNNFKSNEEDIKSGFSVRLNDFQKENKNHKHKLAVLNYKALLVDKIKNSDIRWHTAKQILKEDNKWKFSQDLDKKTREHLFTEYSSVLKCKRVDRLHRFLDILPNVTLRPSWLDMQNSSPDDARSGRYFSDKANFKN